MKKYKKLNKNINNKKLKYLKHKIKNKKTEKDIKKENEITQLSNDIIELDASEEFKSVKSVQVVDVIGIINDDNIKTINEKNIIVNAGDFSNEKIKIGDTIWISCIINKIGYSFSPQQLGVLKCRVSDIYIGTSKLSQLMR